MEILKSLENDVLQISKVQKLPKVADAHVIVLISVYSYNIPFKETIYLDMLCNGKFY